MKVSNQTISIADYIPHPRNYNRHPDLQVQRIMASLTKFGQVRSVVVWQRYIIAGHGVIQAATKLGWTTIQADVLPDDYPEHLALAYLAADNELGKLGDPDQAALAAILSEVSQTDAGLLEAIGYDEAGFKALLDSVTPAVAVADAGPQVDKAEELRVKWGVELGDLWQLGKHRLICGDCTDRATVAKVLMGERASCIFTDPPYGVAIGAKNRLLNSVQKAGRNLTDIEDDSLSPDELRQRLLPAFRLVREAAMADDCTIFVTSPQGGDLMSMMMMMMREAGLPIRHVLIWMKNAPTFSMGRLDYDYQHEPILLTWGKRHKRPMQGDHKTSVWKIDKPRVSPDHPTMKPVELVVNALLNNSDKGDITYEPYSGSGTALIACEQLSRQCRAVEISPAYVAVALERWATATGKQPERIQ